VVSERKWEAAYPASHLVWHPEGAGKIMKNIKFVVRVNRGGTRAPEYVQRIDRTPIRMTTHRMLALVMGRFTAEDTVKSIQNSRRSPELVPVQV
jgi:hypothetical protein